MGCTRRVALQTGSVAMENQKQLAFIFLCFCIVDLCHTQDKDFAGPFRVVVHQIAQCDDSGTRQIYISSTKINKVSRTKYLFSTNVTSEILVNDDMGGELDIAVFGNGGWRPHFMQTEFTNFCTTIRQMLPIYFEAISNCFGMDCPAPPGNYVCNNLDMSDFKMIPSFPAFPFGKYRCDFTGIINNTKVGCLRYYIDVLPAIRIGKKKKQKKPKNK